MSVQRLVAQDRRLPGMNGVNHLAFATPQYDAMRKFYRETLGFQEAFTIKNAAGQPTLTYIQTSRNPFVELMPAGANRERGVDPGTPRIIGSGSLTVAITDPDGNRLELSELPPDAPARKAMNAWK